MADGGRRNPLRYRTRCLFLLAVARKKGWGCKVRCLARVLLIYAGMVKSAGEALHVHCIYDLLSELVPAWKGICIVHSHALVHVYIYTCTSHTSISILQTI
jgi:hypothetical protein